MLFKKRNNEKIFLSVPLSIISYIFSYFVLFILFFSILSFLILFLSYFAFFSLPFFEGFCFFTL